MKNKRAEREALPFLLQDLGEEFLQTGIFGVGEKLVGGGFLQNLSLVNLNINTLHIAKFNL